MSPQQEVVPDNLRNRPGKNYRSEGKLSHLFKKAVHNTLDNIRAGKENEEERSIGRGYMIGESNDGKFKYKIAIIDFLTKYSSMKLLENQFKSRVHGVDKMTISAIDQDNYQIRFVKFMHDNL